MTTRRDFLRSSTAAALTTTFGGAFVEIDQATARTSEEGREWIGRFEVEGRARFGRLKGDKVVLLSAADDPHAFPPASASGARADSAETIPLDKASWLSPLYGGQRGFSAVLNFPPHAEETSLASPERPFLFYKPPSAFVAPNGRLHPRPGFTEEFDYEGEIAVVIGRECRNVPVEDALSCVRGLTAFMDGSARDRLRVTGGPGTLLDWISAKAFDNGSLAGPVVAMGPRVMEGIRTRSIGLRTLLNGEVVQEASLGDLVYSVEHLISYLSSVMTLFPGDVIGTGTPGGVGQARGRFLQSGDRIELEVTHLPRLVGLVA